MGFKSWAPDDLPARLDARYEKEIINKYRSETGTAPLELVEKGYPARWPQVSRLPPERLAM
jgi:hypothetical protein